MEEYIKKQLDRERDEELLHLANNNSYLLVTGKKTLDEILKRRGEQSFVTMPDETPDSEDLLLMIEYFIETEEYEKCAELRDILIGSGELLEDKSETTASRTTSC
jgi:hypothetical protein|tara:strand:+ start:1408 stop:1722 length:315 start_codon:yes stop_codon:yes gene_type:complete